MPVSQAYQGIAVTVFSGLKGERPAPKAGALPTALHPVIKLNYPAGRILPNQARYQLRYTRILSDLMGMDPPEATRRRALHTIPVHYNTPAAKREAYSYPFFFAGKTLA